MYALRGVVCSKYTRNYLVYYVGITHVYAKPEYTPMKPMKCVEKHVCSCEPKCTSAVGATYNAHVQFLQIKDACMLFVQLLMHTAAY